MSGGALRCSRCDSVIADDDLRCPICHLPTPPARTADLPETTIEILRCSGCGAAMTYDVAKRAAACAFCGSVLSVERPTDPIEEAHLLAPFTIDRDRARDAFRGWLGSLGWFRPGDLRSAATLETIQPLHWVAWTFDARAQLSWAADTDHGARRADWAPHTGEVDLDYDDVVVPATRGLTRDEVARLLPSYDLGSLNRASDDAVDTTVERFDVSRSVARGRLIEAVERLARRRLAECHLPGTRFRNLATSTVLRSLAARRIGLPAWVLAYRYKGRLYRAVLSGQDASCLDGTAPYSALKIAAVAVGAATALALLVVVGLVL
ncbi:MAG: zinc ribbon domain-containing protein [Holophagae bacterium]|jgi:hypothetical protein